MGEYVFTLQPCFNRHAIIFRLYIFMFSQHCIWGFRSSGIWCYVVCRAYILPLRKRCFQLQRSWKVHKEAIPSCRTVLFICWLVLRHVSAWLNRPSSGRVLCAVLIVKVETNAADIIDVSLKMAYYVREVADR